MTDKSCPYFSKSSMAIEYCKLKPPKENLDGSYRYISCNCKKRWELYELVLEKQRNDLEKELDKF